MAHETFDHGIPPELAPVRAGQELPWKALEAYLRPILQVDGPITVLQFPNGSANLTYLLTFVDKQFVLRRPPFGRIAPGAHDMKREYRVLSRLWCEFGRAPRAFVLCDDHNIIGSDFVVSEYRKGEVVWAALPQSMADLPNAGRRIGLATVDALAMLHLVEPAACDLDDLGRPVGYLARQLTSWRRRWELVATDEHMTVMTSTAAQLERTLPTSTTATLLHNDFKTDNCQFLPAKPDHVSAVFDWDMATLGDPLADLGTLLNYWPDPSDSPDDRALHVAGLELLGFPSRAELIERYTCRTGFDTSHIAWYEAFACWRTCVILQQLHQRYLRGETTDERMANRGQPIGMLSRRAARILAGR